jgi:hypothetical protein
LIHAFFRIATPARITIVNPETKYIILSGTEKIRYDPRKLHRIEPTAHLRIYFFGICPPL